MVQDSNDARQRLLDTAREVFAAKGYEGASTREMCRRAHVNVAAIHYYFGDKATLYRRVFDTFEQFQHVPPALRDTGLCIDDKLDGLYRHLLSFAALSASTQSLRVLFLREQLQPTGLLGEHQMLGMDPLYQSLLQALEAHFKAPADAALRQLALSLLGIAAAFVVGGDSIDRLAPELISGKEQTVARLSRQGAALVALEVEERALMTSTRSPVQYEQQR